MDDTELRTAIYNKLVKPDLDRVTSLWHSQRDQLNQEIQKQTLAAQQQARAYGDAVIQNAMQNVQRRFEPEFNHQLQQIQKVEDYKAGKISSIWIGSSGGGGGETWNVSSVPRDSYYVNHTLESLKRKYQELTDPFNIKRLALEQLTNDYTINRNNINDIERQYKELLYQEALPQAESFLTNSLYNRRDDMFSQFDKEITKLQNEGNQKLQNSVDQYYSFVRQQENDFNNQLKNLYDSGQWSPEKEQAIRDAQRAQQQFVTSSNLAFTPEAYNQAPQIYEQTYQQLLKNIPQVSQPQTATLQQPTALQPEQQQTVAQPVTSPITTPTTQAPLAAPVTQPPLTAPVTQQTPPLAAPQEAAPITQATQVTQPTTQSSFLGSIPVGTQPTSPDQSAGTFMTPTTTALNPNALPPLRSAGGEGTSAIDPTLRPYLELGLRAAEQQFLQNVPQFFPGQTYVSPSQQTLDALAAQEQLARQAPTTLQAAQESYMRGLGGLGATASGAFLMGNPYQQQMIQAATRPIMQQFEEQTLPGIASGFSGAGRYGSGAMERALGRATESTARALGDVGTNIAFQDYSAERGRQQQAILGQITAAGQAPQIYGQQFLPSQQLAQIGAAREQIAGLPLQEQMARFQFAQQAPRESLSAFLSSVYGTPMASSQYAPQQQAQTNRFGSVLGGAATGAAIGNMIPSLGAGWGAALGGIGGLLA